MFFSSACAYTPESSATKVFKSRQVQIEADEFRGFFPGHPEHTIVAPGLRVAGHLSQFYNTRYLEDHRGGRVFKTARGAHAPAQLQDPRRKLGEDVGFVDLLLVPEGEGDNAEDTRCARLDA